MISEETRLKMRMARLGKPRPDMVGNKINLGRKHGLNMRNKMRNLMLGNKINLGRKGSPRQREIARIRLSGKNNPRWNNGATSENNKIRNSREYILWRTSVFSKDNFTCKHCNASGVYLHAHHIKPFSKYPELRFALDNGLTLCRPCHYEIHRNPILLRT